MKYFIFIFICIGLVLLDNHAASYCNGLYFQSKSLNYSLAVSKVGNVWVTFDGGFGYLVPGQEYKHASETPIAVEKVLGHSIKDNNVFIKIKSLSGTKVLEFNRMEDVFTLNPNIIQNTSRTENLKWYDLENIPTIFYFWKVIGPLIFLIASLLLFLSFRL